MTNIDTKGMKAADLTEEQLAELNRAQQKMNDAGNNTQEIYLLAVSR
jgi:hypothetical protein